jgi:hypothetical protein
MVSSEAPYIRRTSNPKNMKRHKHKAASARADILKLAALGSAGLGLVCGVRADTIITFEGFTGNNSSIATIPGFGDNVSAAAPDYIVSPGLGGILGTPDISLEWVGQWETYTSWDGRGSVAQSDFNGGPSLSILFMPSALSAVRLGAFDLDYYAGAPGDGSIAWSISGISSGILANGDWTMGTAGGRTTIAPGVNGQLGETLQLSLQLNSGAPSYFALDNLTFAQVPEPSTIGLGLLAAAGALGAAAMRRRKRD